MRQGPAAAPEFVPASFSRIMRGSKRLQAIQARIQRGDLDGAIEEYEKAVEGEPDDWSSVAALGDLYLQKGDVENGVTQLTRVADHFLSEGFYARAAALYRRVLKLVEDDHALLSLADIAARQGLLTEARHHLMLLERQRRARGDLAGADACLASLEAIVDAQTRVPEPPPIPVPRAPLAPVEEAPTDAPPAPQGFDTTGSGPVADPARADEAALKPFAAGDAQPESETGSADTSAPVQESAPARHTASRARQTGARSTPTRPGSGRRARSLGDVFKQLRSEAEQDEDVSACHERFDLAQHHLQEGDEEAAASELEHAARAPTLRFVASAQLGRLHVSRGDLAAGIEWLERATQVPPVSPDEGHAVLYELADALERVGEAARALVVFMQLAAQRRAYRDVAARIAALSGDQGQGDRT